MNISLKKLIFEAEGDVPPQKGAKPPTQAPAAAPKAAPTPKSPPTPAPAAENNHLLHLVVKVMQIHSMLSLI